MSPGYVKSFECFITSWSRMKAAFANIQGTIAVFLPIVTSFLFVRFDFNRDFNNTFPWVASFSFPYCTKDKDLHIKWFMFTFVLGNFIFIVFFLFPLSRFAVWWENFINPDAADHRLWFFLNINPVENTVTILMIKTRSRRMVQRQRT